MKCYDDICDFLGKRDNNQDDVILTSPAQGESRKLTSRGASESASVSAFKTWTSLQQVLQCSTHLMQQLPGSGFALLTGYRRIYGQCKAN